MYQLYDMMFGMELVCECETLEEVRRAYQKQERETDGVWWPMLKKDGERRPIEVWKVGHAEE